MFVCTTKLELVCAVNILQFIFLALRLDGFVHWSWEVVFVPLWIVLCLSVVGLLYAIIFAGILLRTPNASPEQRRTSAHTALGYSFLILPILGFLVRRTSVTWLDLDIFQLLGLLARNTAHRFPLVLLCEVGPVQLWALVVSLAS